MKLKFVILAVGLSGIAASSAAAQPYSLDWSAITSGGDTTPIAAGSFTLQSTIGESLAAAGSAGAYSLTSGFLAVSGSGPLACYANCDGSTVEPVLNVDDFTCFINAYASAQALPHAQQVTHYANCDGSAIAPALNVDDFTCFINEYAAGCR